MLKPVQVRAHKEVRSMVEKTYKILEYLSHHRQTDGRNNE